MKWVFLVYWRVPCAEHDEKSELRFRSFEKEEDASAYSAEVLRAFQKLETSFDGLVTTTEIPLDAGE